MPATGRKKDEKELQEEREREKERHMYETLGMNRTSNELNIAVDSASIYQ